MATYARLNNLVFVFPFIVAAVLAYFHHAMKTENAKLEPEQLMQSPGVIVCTLVTGALTLWLLMAETNYAKALHLLGPLSW